MPQILITGVAGFIGFHTALKMLKEGFQVYGLDNLNDYYDIQLKKDRLEILGTYPSFVFEKVDIAKGDQLRSFFDKYGGFTQVIHLAAQAGVRFSVQNPGVYVESNLLGFTNILECCRYTPHFKHLVYASTSSVYGANETLPFSENQITDRSVSFYAATKKANELMAQSYYSLYNLPVTGLRYFTVYGPWGRPDMALFKFTKAILKGEPIQVFNHGQMSRDFTYVEDIVEGTLGALAHFPPNYSKGASHPVYNMGNKSPRALEDFITCLEKHLGKKAIKEYLALQLGDVRDTYSDCTKAMKDFGYNPKVDIEEGIENFVLWFREYFKV